MMTCFYRIAAPCRKKNITRALSCAVLALAVFCIRPSDAQAESICAAEAPEWDPPSAGPITTWTAPLCGKHKLVVQSFFLCNWARGIFDAEGHYHSLPGSDQKSSYEQQVFFQFGLLDRVELDFQTAIQENFVKTDGQRVHSNGFTDSYLWLRGCLVEEQGWLPHVTGQFQLKFPTGKFEKTDPDKLGTDLFGAQSGGGSYDHGYGINFSKKLKPFIVHADATCSFPITTRVDGVRTRYAPYWTYDFGAEYFLPKGFNVVLEFNGIIQGDTRKHGEPVPSTAMDQFIMSPGLGWACERVQTLIAYQRMFYGKNSDATDSLAMTCVVTF